MHNTFEECLFIKVTYAQVMTNRMGNPKQRGEVSFTINTGPKRQSPDTSTQR